MKNRIVNSTDAQVDEVIATFGDAKLVRVRGRICLRGGTMSDRMEALEWMSLFLPEEVTQVGRNG